MLVVCDQCQARYKITIAKSPGKAVTFKCGKCQHLIRLTPEQIEAGSAPATGLRPAAVKPVCVDKPAPASKPAPAAPASDDAETVRGTCLKCGAAFVKPVTDKSPVCYQCRIDSLVNKVREKYGVNEETAEPASEAPPTAPEPEAAPAPESRYTVRSADGLVLGPIKFRTVAVLAREKRIGGREEVAKDDGEFAALMSYPELAELFPDLKEILDTDGLEDKVDEAFMAAFGADEGEGKAERDDAETEADIAGLGALDPEPPPAPTEEEPPSTEPEETSAQADKEPAASEPEEPPVETPTVEEPAPPVEEEPALGLDDLEGSAEESAAQAEPDEPTEFVDEPAEPEAEPSEPEPEAPPEPEPVEEPEAPESEETEAEATALDEAPAAEPEADNAEFEHSFSLNEPTPGPRRAVELQEAAEEASKPEPPMKIVEKSPALEEPVAAADVGTEFDVGEEWNGEEDEAECEDEVIEDLEAIEPPPDARYRIRYPDGLMLGPVKFGTIKELFKTGNLTGQEDVQRDDLDWVPFTELPELAVLVAEAELIVEDDFVELTDLLEEK